MREENLSCREIRDALTDAALAGAADARLRGHLAECASCRGEFDRLAMLAGAIDRGVSQMVSVEPSPGFAAGVRVRVAEESAPSFAWWRGWAPATVAGVAVLALAAWLLWPNAQNPASPGTPNTAKDERAAPPAQAPETIDKGASPAPVKQRERDEVAGNLPPRAPRAPGAPRASVPPRRSETPALPEVLIAGDEWAQVVKLYELSQRGRADLGKVEIDATPLEEKAHPLLIARLDPIKPIVEETPPPPTERQ